MATAIEYGLIAAGLSVAVIAVVQGIEKPGAFPEHVLNKPLITIATRPADMPLNLGTSTLFTPVPIEQVDPWSYKFYAQK